MREFVVDASVIWYWFEAESTAKSRIAISLAGEYEREQIFIHSPRLIFLELLNTAARSKLWPESEITALALKLDGLNFAIAEPDLESVGRWASRGLSAYDANYVALAESFDLPLITDDRQIITTARSVAVPLLRYGQDPRTVEPKPADD